jgi:hypothetical protein
MRKILVNSRRPVEFDTIALDLLQSQDIARHDDQGCPDLPAFRRVEGYDAQVMMRRY